MAKILAFTAGTGKKSGGEFVRRLAENIGTVNEMFPDGLRAIVRPTSNTAELRKLLPGTELCAGALEDIDFLKKSLEGVDTLVHIAGIHWSVEVVDAAAACGVRRLILVHTTGIYSKYKEAGEEYRQIDDHVYSVCRENGIVLTILRPTMIYGNVHDCNVVTFIKMVDKFPIMPVVSGARYQLQPVHYTDLATAYYQVLTNEEKTGGRDFVLSGAEPIYLRDMFKVIGENLGKKVRFISCPFFIAYSGAWVIYCLTLGKVDYREKVQRLCEPRVYSHDDAAETFGYAPLTFEEGVAGEVREYMETMR